MLLGCRHDSELLTGAVRDPKRRVTMAIEQLQNGQCDAAPHAESGS